MIQRDKIKVGAKIIPIHVEQALGDTTFCCYPIDRPDRTKCISCSFFNGEPRTIKGFKSGYKSNLAVFSELTCFPLSIESLAEEFELVDEYIWRKL